MRPWGVLKNWIDRGELPGIRIGARRVRVRKSDLARYIAESTAAQAPSELGARMMFDEALEAAVAAAGTGGEPAALRSLAKAASTLARAIG